MPVAGGEPRRLTSNPASDSRPRFSPDGRTLAFLSTRDGSSQVWALDLAGGEARKLTSLATGVDAFEWLGRSAPRARERGVPGLRRGRRVQREEARRGRQALHGAGLRRAALPPLGHLGRRPPQPRAVLRARRRRARRPHARRRRRAALQPRRRGLGRGAGRQRGVRGAQGREGRGLAHERRALPGPRDRGRSPPHLRLARLRQRLPLQPRRALPRLPHAAARGLRGRSAGGSSSTTGRAARSARSPSRSTARSTRWCSRRTRRRSTSRPRTKGLSPVFSVPVAGGAGHEASSPGRARSGTWGSRATARRSSPRTRRSPTPRRWCASGRTGRGSRA